MHYSGLTHCSVLWDHSWQAQGIHMGLFRIKPGQQVPSLLCYRSGPWYVICLHTGFIIPECLFGRRIASLCGLAVFQLSTNGCPEHCSQALCLPSLAWCHCILLAIVLVQTLFLLLVALLTPEELALGVWLDSALLPSCHVLHICRCSSFICFFEDKGRILEEQKSLFRLGGGMHTICQRPIVWPCKLLGDRNCACSPKPIHVPGHKWDLLKA